MTGVWGCFDMKLNGVVASVPGANADGLSNRGDENLSVPTAAGVRCLLNGFHNAVTFFIGADDFDLLSSSF